MAAHKSLNNVIEDQVCSSLPPRYHTSIPFSLSPPQLSLAAMHYLRTHYQEAIDIYKRVLLDNR